MNRSVVRTKKAIRKVFLELLEEKKDIDKITVIELTNRVGIVRSTFYSHYKDIEDVAKEIQNEMLDYIDSLINEFKSGGMDFKTLFTKFFTFFADRQLEYKDFFKSDFGDNRFVGEFKTVLAKRLYENYPFANVEFFNGDKEFEAKFFAAIFTGLITQFVQGNINYTLDELIDFTLRFIDKIKK